MSELMASSEMFDTSEICDMINTSIIADV